MQNTFTQNRKEPSVTNTNPMHWQLEELETLISQLQQLLSLDPGAFDDKNIRRELEVMERWRAYYHHNLVTFDAFSETSQIVLTNLRDRLKLALEEIQRLEGEGGATTSSKEQVEKNEALVKAIRRIEIILNRNSRTPHQ